MTDKVTSVAIEFLCLFLISGELFYDLEYQVRVLRLSQIPDDCFISQLVTVCPYVAQYGTDTFQSQPQYNPNISDIGDALYWSFLTLTGIGQPFEAVTAAGRVATVGSILTALVVVPLQLAKIVGNQDGNGGGAVCPELCREGCLVAVPSVVFLLVAAAAVAASFRKRNPTRSRRVSPR